MNLDEDYSYPNSEDEDVNVVCHIPHKEAKASVSLTVQQQKPRLPQHTGFKPTNPVFYPKLKFVKPDLTEGAENKLWVKMPSTRDTFFNYGFTEEVWEAYKFKQLELRRIFAKKSRHRDAAKTEEKTEKKDEKESR
ncbi:hypothetical protein TVAG_193460 [Trichomonas vaginalis G3]|uniref:Pre-mRNA polyadenylation factor Fip1 domain-containing protein n=1 Tax=Trichomonas vaginalis (strain ATCC PRA-98 / G3) TaxID=412133 RepID=A2DH60_TRIV3|nr:Fip1 motif family [Trichomonas vaginalis G3]EAY20370.1 hypothetical protein TVAG_193460 [Trichomonas vaginalis G3]KAI5530630.1 Fip1 motif family [Trichomonas vaginalis G3]|eukprot:XP_001581356.1 hypothetical protein [Trichomonas vaginalis G3]